MGIKNLENQSMQTEKWFIREELSYDRNNLWIRIDDGAACIGLSDYGQWVIGDILYLDLIKEGTGIVRGERFGSVESGKWVGHLIAPVSGRVLEVNPLVIDDPRRIQSDPYGKGWLMKVDLASKDNIGSFLDYSAYAEFVKEQLQKEE